jgi:hypothetical protein
MTIDELKRSYPAVFQEAFSRGFNSGLKCQLASARDTSEKRKLEAANLIVDSRKNRTPVGFARVDSEGGASFVVPVF